METCGGTALAAAVTGVPAARILNAVLEGVVDLTAGVLDLGGFQVVTLASSAPPTASL